jgi:hypothetical protein
LGNAENVDEVGLKRFRWWKGRASERDQHLDPMEMHDTYDAARSTKDLCWEVGGELGLDDTRVSVRTGDTAGEVSDVSHGKA